MPKSGFVSVTIRDAIYELARAKAEKEGMKISEFTERAIRSYVASWEGIEDRAKLIAELLRRLEDTRVNEATSTRQMRLALEGVSEQASQRP